MILAGGTGTRLLPLTRAVNKHLIAVGGMPMLYHPIQKMVRAGIKEILVVTGTEHAGGIFQLLGSGSDFGCEFTFRVQDKAGGISQALRLAKDFVKEDPFCVLLGDNIFQEELRPYVIQFREKLDTVKTWNPCGMVLLKEVDDPCRFGVAVIEGETIVRFVEKPKEPISTWAVTGIYFYCGQGIFDLIDGLAPSGRGELEITDLNQELLKMNTLFSRELRGWWTDAGNHDSLWTANKLVRGMQT